MSSSTNSQQQKSQTTTTLDNEEFLDTNLARPNLNKQFEGATIIDSGATFSQATKTSAIPATVAQEISATFVQETSIAATSAIISPTTTNDTTEEPRKPASKKITVLFKAVGSAPILKQKFFEVESSRTIAAIVAFLRKILRVDLADSLFVYVNSSFSPTNEHTIDQLCQCFGNSKDNKLTLQYSLVQAWG